MMKAELLLRQMLDAIRLSATKNGRGFHAVQVFRNLPDGWLAETRDLLEERQTNAGWRPLDELNSTREGEVSREYGAQSKGALFKCSGCGVNLNPKDGEWKYCASCLEGIFAEQELQQAHSNSISEKPEEHVQDHLDEFFLDSDELDYWHGDGFADDNLIEE